MSENPTDEAGIDTEYSIQCGTIANQEDRRRRNIHRTLCMDQYARVLAWISLAFIERRSVGRAQVQEEIKNEKKNRENSMINCQCTHEH